MKKILIMEHLHLAEFQRMTNIYTIVPKQFTLKIDTGKLLLTIFFFLTIISSYFMWLFIEWIVVVHFSFILLIVIIGENYVIKKGYYSYSPDNRPFFENVPLWIILMWIFFIQSTALLGHALGLGYVDIIIPPLIRWGGIVVCLFSGILCLIIDFLVLEPLFSRNITLWTWNSVESGFFAFIPKKFNKFTAPIGNYLVWFGFPIIANYVAVLLFAITN